MKIKIFRDNNSDALIDKINNFIHDKQIIDIKYQPEFVSVEFKDGVPIRGVFYESALVMYNEHDV